MNIQFHGTSQQGKGVFVQPPPPIPPDAISTDPTVVLFDTAGSLKPGNDMPVVTCNDGASPGSWTAVTSDIYNIVSGFTNAGGDGDTMTIVVNTNSSSFTECQSAYITLTCGDATCEVAVSQDGTATGC